MVRFIHFMLVVLAISFSNAASQEKEKKLTLNDVPKAVLAAFRNVYPNAKIVGVESEKENGTLYFEVESLDGSVRRDLQYTSDGTLTETEERIAMTDVPVAVKETLTKEFSKAKIRSAEKVTRGSSITYEIVVRMGKRNQEVVIDPSGKVLKGDQE